MQVAPDLWLLAAGGEFWKLHLQMMTTMMLMRRRRVVMILWRLVTSITRTSKRALAVRHGDYDDGEDEDDVDDDAFANGDAAA